MSDEVRLHLEIIRYDPEDPDTYPSVCHHAEEVRHRFGLTGGEVLVFNVGGNYLGVAQEKPQGERKVLEIELPQ